MTIGTYHHQIFVAVVLAIAVNVMNDQNIKIIFTANRATRASLQDGTLAIFSDCSDPACRIKLSHTLARTEMMFVRLQMCWGSVNQFSAIVARHLFFIRPQDGLTHRLACALCKSITLCGTVHVARILARKLRRRTMKHLTAAMASGILRQSCGIMLSRALRRTKHVSAN